MLVSVVIPVYRDGARALAAANAMLVQSLPAEWSLEVILVDDGSGDGTAGRLACLDDARARLITLPENVGRAAARNAGARAARGEILVFMDCDCLPLDNRFVASHLTTLRHCVGSTGPVWGFGKGFWNRYQRDASSRRERLHSAGVTWAGSSQNLAARATEFNAIGGFDTRYRAYGFEDRDLLIRLARLGTVEWCKTARVEHTDALSLGGVGEKMFLAGQYSSWRFSRDHPAEYRLLGYGSLDANLRPLLRLAAPMAGASAKIIARYLDRSHALQWLPYAASSVVTRAVSAMHYLAGTAASRMAR